MSRLLTEQHKKILRSWGFSEEDFPQISKAMWETYTSYTYISHNGDEKEITRETAIKKLGIKTYLSGISRSAFHRSAVRDTKDGRGQVYFDSKKLFR